MVIRIYLFLLFQAGYTATVAAFFSSLWATADWQSKVAIVVMGLFCILVQLSMLLHRQKEYIKVPAAADEAA